MPATEAIWGGLAIRPMATTTGTVQVYPFQVDCRKVRVISPASRRSHQAATSVSPEPDPIERPVFSLSGRPMVIACDQPAPGCQAAKATSVWVVVVTSRVSSSDNERPLDGACSHTARAPPPVLAIATERLKPTESVSATAAVHAVPV